MAWQKYYQSWDRHTVFNYSNPNDMSPPLSRVLLNKRVVGISNYMDMNNELHHWFGLMRGTE